MYYTFQTKKRAIYQKLRKNSSFIEINGKQYDAITGQLIGAVKQAHAHLKHAAKGQVIDGLVQKMSPSIAKRTAPAKRSMHPAQTVHRRTQHSKTLMRRVVPRPKTPKANSHRFPLHKTKTPMINKTRLSQAVRVPKSGHIKRFGGIAGAPSQAAVAAKNIRRKEAMSGEVINSKPMAGSVAVAARPLPSMITSVSHQRLERMLDDALLQADAHKQALAGRLSRKRRLNPYTWLVIGIVLLVVALASAFVAWRYIPHVSMKVASMRARISGSIPAYVPSGFKSAGPINYENGALKITYKAGDGRSFTIAQQASNWDSSSLEANALPQGSQVQTSQVKGTTVYIYDSKNHATWVNEGIRYTINDDAKLTSDQLLKIAEGL